MDKNSALLVVDIQKDATGKNHKSIFSNTEKFIENVNEVIGLFEKNLANIFYIKHELKDNIINRLIMKNRFIENTEGSSIDDRVKIVSDNIYTKNIGDALSNKSLEMHLKKLNISKIYIIGLDAKFCVFSTGKGAIKRGYETYILKECILTKNMESLNELENNYIRFGIKPIEIKDLFKNP